MKPFKLTYRDKDGKAKKTDVYYIKVKDHKRIWRRFPACKESNQSQRLAEKIEQLVSNRIAGLQPNPELSRWLEQTPQDLRERLVKFDLLDNQRAAAGKPLSEHLEDFRKTLSGRCSEVHVRVTCSRIESIFTGCKFLYWSDIQASKVQGYLDNLDIHPKTYNYYLTSFRQFGRWMVRDRRASESPVEHLRRVWVDRTTEYRRALSFEEVCRLLEATEDAPDRFGMTGHERAVLYLVTIETGCRASEMRRLKVSDFNFVDAIVTLEGHRNRKNKTTIEQLLRLERADQLKEFFHCKLPEAKAFNMPSEYRTASMLKADLEEAGIEYIDGSGRKADFHSLRHTLATALDRTNATLKERMAITRHSDTGNLTMGVYTHIEKHNLRDVIEQLPAYIWPGLKKDLVKNAG